MDRTVGTILTVLSTLLCGACSIFFCAAGLLAAIFKNQVRWTDTYGTTRMLVYSSGWVILLLAIAVLLLVVPIVVGILTLRSRPTPPAVPPSYPPDQPLPPGL